MCAAGFVGDAAGERDAADLPREFARGISLPHPDGTPVTEMIRTALEITMAGGVDLC